MREKSRVDRKNVIVLGVPIAYFLIMSLLSVYAWMRYGIVKPMELFIYILFSAVLIERGAGKYEYELDEQQLKIIKHGFLFKIKAFQIPLDRILGVYIYKSKLIGLIKFRHTYRMHSALDGRAVWTLAYSEINRKGKLENSRMYIKPSDEMLDFLKQRIPDRVRVTEEELAVRLFNEENR